MFEDFNLKLAVLSVLMEAGHYATEAERLADIYGAAVRDDEAIPEVLQFYRGIELRPALLATVTRLCPDGGDLAYEHCMSVWDGEDGQFDIRSLEGIHQLTNLIAFTPVSMMAEGGVDYGPLLACQKLARVDMSFALPGKQSESVAATLRGRGVVVENQR